MNSSRIALSLALFISFLGLYASNSLFAHGALIKYAFTPAITVQVKYDNGQPMPGAQVTVYSPDNPAKPWLVGTSDEQGRFSFLPDPDKTGTWTIQARQAGHGAMIHIPVEPTSEQDSGPAAVSPGPNTAQRLLMALAVVWGFVGTAFFFLRKRDTSGAGPPQGPVDAHS